MPTVDFSIRNKSYSIACNPGEEANIHKLAEQLSVRVEAISKTFGTASDRVVLAITALMMEDEISALQQQLADAKAATPTTSSATSGGISEEQANERINQALVSALEPIAKYVEGLANKIERQYTKE